MSPRHGLVIGKFYPPHAGHHLLVRTAARLCARVTVVVMAARVEGIGLERRVAWMREIHAPEQNVTITGIWDDVPVDYESDAIWAAHVALMRQAVLGVTAEHVDAVVTSEPYGDELARRFGARAVLVDVGRDLAPVSGTAVRSSPAATWSFLEPCVREALAARLVVVGAESTGKTTLAAAIAEALRAQGGALGLTRWVTEVGRDVTIDKLALARAQASLVGAPAPRMKSLAWRTEDFVSIAAVQARREAEDARVGGPLLVCDTDAFATGVWHERYVGTRSDAVEAIATADAGGPRRLYLLTHPDDVPLVDDGLRDGDRTVRAWMTDVFVQRLQESGRSWQWLRGSRARRLAAGIDAGLGLVAAGSGLPDPIG
jgi:HTH-type transcriptional regulator, transcriptional repressor of NAD biosynthesis genes